MVWKVRIFRIRKYITMEMGHCQDGKMFADRFPRLSYGEMTDFYIASGRLFLRGRHAIWKDQFLLCAEFFQKYFIDAAIINAPVNHGRCKSPEMVLSVLWVGS